MLDATSHKSRILTGAAVFILSLILIGGGLFWYQNRQQLPTKNKISSNSPAVNNQSNTSADLQEAIKVRALDESDHVSGSLQAPIQLIFYGDFDCPFCASFYDTLKKVKTEFKDKVAIGFRNYPLPGIHNMALSAALASECAAEQGKFWEMYDKLFTDKQENKMDLEQFAKDAAVIGLDTKKFKDCLDTGKYKDKIQSQLQEAKKFNVNGPPYSFINGEYLSGAKPWDDYKDQEGVIQEGLKSVVNRILAEKK
jgi:protein-disulfide isomerase